MRKSPTIDAYFKRNTIETPKPVTFQLFHQSHK